MDERETRIETRFYDADGNRTDDAKVAVRAETVEVDADGEIVRRFENDGPSWLLEPKAIERDEENVVTRPDRRDGR